MVGLTIMGLMLLGKMSASCKRKVMSCEQKKSERSVFVTSLGDTVLGKYAQNMLDTLSFTSFPLSTSLSTAFSAFRSPAGEHSRVKAL